MLESLFFLLLIVLGVIAGIINTLAGGGSNLTIPALMVMGLPADVANGTNRVGVFLQALIGVTRFRQKGHLPTNDLRGILLPTLSGGLLGACIASFAPEWLLKPLLLGTMLAVSLLMVLRPNSFIPSENTTPKRVNDTPMAFVTLFLAGVYGGFVQAGVGFVLITAFAGLLQYDLVKSNALKLLATISFTTVSLAIFIWQDQVWWTYGLILAIGTMIGAEIGVRLSIKAKPEQLRLFLFVMTLAGVIAAIVF